MELVSICNVPAIASPEGLAGKNAAFMLPEYGIYFLNGQRITFANSLLPQSSSRDINGVRMNTPFRKTAGLCINA